MNHLIKEGLKNVYYKFPQIFQSLRSKGFSRQPGLRSYLCSNFDKVGDSVAAVKIFRLFIEKLY